MSDNFDNLDSEKTQDDGSGDPLGIIGWVIGSKYKIRAYIGGGGFGEVYEGFNVNLPDQRLVIKFFKRVQSRDKFVKEAKILCLLDHVNILRIIDFLPEEGALIVPFIDGIDGAGMLKRSGPLKEELYLKVARTMTDALAYTHEHKIAHRDIKPGNILIDKNENTYLIDFGIAKEIKDSATKTAYVALTPMFAAPERQGGEQDYNPFISDIYEMGVTLFNFATNEMPYRMPSNPNIQEWGGPSIKGLSPQLRRILKKATHPDPGERYQSAALLAAELKKLEHVYVHKSKSRVFTIAAIIIVILGAAFVAKKMTSGPSQENTSPGVSVIRRGQDQGQAKQGVEDTVKAIVQNPEQPRADTTSVETQPVDAAKKDTVSAESKVPESTLPVALVHVVPQYNVSLFIDGKEKSPDKRFELQPGIHEVKIIHPDYPILIDSVDISVDRNMEYNLASRYAGVASINFRIGIIPPDLAISTLGVSFNGKKRRYKNDELPILDLKILSGKWQLRFDITSPGGAGGRIDSITTFPYGGGPHIKLNGNAGLVDFGASEWQGMENIDMVIFWTNK